MLQWSRWQNHAKDNIYCTSISQILLTSQLFHQPLRNWGIKIFLTKKKHTMPRGIFLLNVFQLVTLLTLGLQYTSDTWFAVVILFEHVSVTLLKIHRPFKRPKRKIIDSNHQFPPQGVVFQVIQFGYDFCSIQGPAVLHEMWM